MKKYGQRLLGTALACAVIVSSFTGLLHVSGSAADEDYTVETAGLDADYVTSRHEGNLIAGLGCTEIGSNGSTVSIGGAHWNGNYTDGKLGNGENAWYGTDWTVKPRFIYDLGEECEIAEILHIATDGNYTREYRISVANTKEALFTENQTAEIVYYNRQKACAQLFKFNEGAKPKGQYVAFEILNPCADGQNIRISELAVYGAPVEIEKDYTIRTDGLDADYVTSRHEGNLIAGLGCTEIGSNGSTVSIGGAHWNGNYTDGKLGNGENAWYGTDWTVKPRFIYDLGEECEIAEILHIATDGNYTREYRISVANTKEALFTENQTAEIVYYNRQKACAQLFKFNEGAKPKGQYVAFEILNPCADGQNIRIDELAVYGTPVETEKNYTVKTDELDVRFVSANHKKNLIAGLGCTEIGSNGSAVSIGGAHWNGNYTDGKLGNGENAWYGTDWTVSPRFIYDLGESREIAEILQFATENNDTMKYRISVAGTKEALFTENQTAEIVYYNRQRGRAQLFKFDEAVTGRYVGFEIITPCSADGQNIRIDELAVYGSATEVPAPAVAPKLNATFEVQTKGIDEKFVSDRAGDNLLNGLWGRLTDDKGNAAKINESPWESLTDAQLYMGTHFNFSAPDDEDIPVRITYDLLQEDVTIDSFLIIGFWNGSPQNYTQQEYEVYISNSLEDLYTDANRMIWYDNRYQYNPGSKEGVGQYFTFTGKKPVGRYVGIRIIDMSEEDQYGRLDQLGIYSAGKTAVDQQNAQCLEDPATGVHVSILRRDAYDIFSGVDRLRVTPVSVPEGVTAAAGHYGLSQLGSALKIELLDKNGKVMDKKALDGRFIKLEFPWPTTGSSRALSYDETQILLCAITEEGTLSQIRFFRDKDYLTAYVEEPGTYALFLNDLDHGNGLDDLKDAARPFAPGEAVPGSPDRKDEDPSPDTGVAPTGLSALLLMLSGVAALLLRGKKKGETPR